uniref:Uncharacterized protein n=1 Tax=Knipowitschia caucasica TaxID=637954 RepID=A0AAV2M6V4_KNICA
MCDTGVWSTQPSPPPPTPPPCRSWTQTPERKPPSTPPHDSLLYLPAGSSVFSHLLMPASSSQQAKGWLSRGGEGGESHLFQTGVVRSPKENQGEDHQDRREGPHRSAYSSSSGHQR